ncbi:MAG TPA: long-chain fatty acid--CoA ligase [Polyangia bacterium]|nr:long-chain fatty acid--CoA ligase [Polyangia bacterium]
METAMAATAKSSAPQAAERPLSVQNGVVMFNDRVKASASRAVLRWKESGSWRSATWAEWDKASREIAAGLLALGVGKGERSCVLANTRPEWLYTDIGILMAGGVTVPIYQSNLANECEYIINDSGAKVVFVENPQQLAKLMAERDRLMGVVKVVYFDPVAKLDKPDAQGRSELTLDDVTKPGDKAWLMSLGDLRVEGGKWLGAHAGELEKRWTEIKPDDSFTFVYTSGTTGPPKGVVLMHKNIVWECDSMKDVLPVDDNDEQLLFLPMAHIFAKILEWVTIAKGSRIAFAESIAKIKDNLAEVRPTFMCAVPRVLEKVYLGILGNRNAAPPTKQRIFDWAFSVGKQVSKYKQRHQPIPLGLTLKNRIATRLVFGKIQSVLGGRIRFLVSGGAPLSKDIAEFFHAAGVLILEGYGLTETTAGSCVNRPEKFAFGSVGVPVPGLEVKIADDGEILIRGGSVMKEYYGKPEATREAIDPEGWFHTGDIGVIEDGIVKITDRKKDIIVNAGGKNIAPQNLENALKATPYISQVMVHGDKRPYLVALLTLNEENVAKWARDNDVPFNNVGDLAQSDKVRGLVGKYIDELNAKEPSYSSIKKFVLLPHDFSQDTGELTPTLKVKRKFTSEKYKDIIDAFYTN